MGALKKDSWRWRLQTALSSLSQWPSVVLQLTHPPSDPKQVFSRKAVGRTSWSAHRINYPSPAYDKKWTFECASSGKETLMHVCSAPHNSGPDGKWEELFGSTYTVGEQLWLEETGVVSVHGVHVFNLPRIPGNSVHTGWFCASGLTSDFHAGDQSFCPVTELQQL